LILAHAILHCCSDSQRSQSNRRSPVRSRSNRMHSPLRQRTWALAATAAILLLLLISSTVSAQHPSGDALYRAYRNAIPANLFARMEADCRVMAGYEERQPVLLDGKRMTRWMPLGATPRTALEEAILHLAKLAKADPARLVGFEWWVQAIGGAAPLGFHVDKDEAVASHEKYLLHPLWSSVFYVTSTGGGTLITNQYSPRGNGYEPEVATEAAWSFPEENKFLLFNGTLLHGVVPGSATGTGGTGQGIERITFLVNFWHVKPKEPNCLPLRHEDVPGLTLLSAAELDELRREEADQPSPKPKRQPLSFVDMTPQAHTDVTRFQMDLPGGGKQHINLPVFETPPTGQTFHLLYEPRRSTKKTRQPKATGDRADEEPKASQSSGSTEPLTAAERAERDELAALSRAAAQRREAAARTAAEKKARRAARRRGEVVPPSAEALAKQAEREEQQRREREQRKREDAAAMAAANGIAAAPKKKSKKAKKASKPAGAAAAAEDEAALAAAVAAAADWPPPPPAPKLRTGSTLERLQAARAIKEQLRERWDL